MKRLLYKIISMKSWLEGKSPQAREITIALWGLSSKINLRIWESFTRNGVKLESVPQQSPCTDTSKEWKRHVTFLVPSHSWIRNNVRSILPELRRKRTGLLKIVQSPVFKYNFAFHLKIRSQEEKWRGIKFKLLDIQYEFFWATMFFFFRSKIISTIYQETLKHFMVSSVGKLYGDVDSSNTWHLPTDPKLLVLDIH